MDESSQAAVDAGLSSHAAQPGEADVRPDDAVPQADEAVGGQTTGASGAPSEGDVLDALSNVIDPELGLDFVELGLIYGVQISDGHVRVTYTLTTPACPIGPMVDEQIEEFVGEVEGVKSVDTEMVFTPAWSPERMSEDAKFALGF
jgi:metal-sulfur cluster biosynthetic enzyme